MGEEKVSIIIVNWNGKEFLKSCLKSIFNQTYSNFEVIVVDNHSFDESVDFIKDNFPDVKIIELDKNYGFAKAANIGIKKATGKYILILNNDIILQPDSLEKMVKFMNERKDVGIIQPKVVISSIEKLDNCGSFFTDFGWPYHRCLYRDPNIPEANVELPVCSAYGACMLIRREVFEKIGLFDEKYFMYGEELDLCCRAWLSGYKVYYVPRTTVFHVKGGSVRKLGSRSPPPILVYHAYKNRLRTYLKDLGFVYLIRVLPLYVLGLIVVSFLYFIRKKKEYTRAIFMAILWNLFNIKDTLYKRKIIQSKRVISDKHIMRIVKRNPPLSYYLEMSRQIMG